MFQEFYTSSQVVWVSLDKNGGIKIKLVVNIKIDADERSILTLNPKFAILKKLEETSVHHDVEICLAKLRYEIQKLELWRAELEREESGYGSGNQAKRRRIENQLSPKEEEEEIIKEAKERQIYDPIRKRFNYTKRRATDIPENNKVKLPEEVDVKHENELGMLRDIVMSEFERGEGGSKRREEKEPRKKESN